MMNITRLAPTISLIIALALAGCGTTNGPSNTSRSGNGSPQSSNYSTYGIVQSIDVVRQDSPKSKIGIGTVAGAVVGGIVGNQVGQGRGNTAATVIGAAGGAYAGHQIENNNAQQTDVYKISVRLNDGSYQTFTQTTSGDLRVGDHVQIENGIARRN
jgi:outer membrane lipoprotein SlyB